MLVFEPQARRQALREIVLAGFLATVAGRLSHFK